MEKTLKRKIGYQPLKKTTPKKEVVKVTKAPVQKPPEPEPYNKTVTREYPSEVLWIKKNKSLLNIYQIEKQVGIGQKTLYNFVTGDYGLSEQWWKPLQKWVQAFIKDTASLIN